MKNEPKVEVVITGFEIKFWDLVWYMVVFGVAAIPAGMALASLYVIISWIPIVLIGLLFG